MMDKMMGSMTDKEQATTTQADKMHAREAWFEHGTARIYYEVMGHGDPVLLLLGWGGSIGELTALRDALVNAGYQVIAADLPGSGRSGPQPRTYTGTYLHDDTQAFIALLDSLALGPAHLVGFSDGGEISLLIAGTAARHARSVVAWGAAGRLHDPQGFARAAMRNMVDNPIPPMQPFRDSLVAAYGEAHARIMTQSFADALDEMIAAGGELGWAVAEQIKCPALLITGEHDFLAPPPVLAQLGERLAQAETITAVGAGHDVHRSHSDWLVSTVVAWLQQH